jgi:hypothetical protein
MEPNEPPFDRCEYLLPPGCKDLSDVIRLAQEQSRRKPRKLRLREKPIVYLPLQITVRGLAVALDTKLPAVIKLLKRMKVFTSVDQRIHFYTAAKVAAMNGFRAKKKGS